MLPVVQEAPVVSEVPVVREVVREVPPLTWEAPPVAARPLANAAVATYAALEGGRATPGNAGQRRMSQSQYLAYTQTPVRVPQLALQTSAAPSVVASPRSRPTATVSSALAMPLQRSQ